MKQRPSTAIALFERGRRHHDSRMATRLASSDDAVLLLRGSVVRSASQSVRDMLGWEPELCIGRTLSELLGNNTYELLDELQTAAENAGTRFATLHALPLENIDGERLWVDATIADRRGESDVNGTVLTLHNVTERVRLEAAIRETDHHDPLTLMPNRRMFELLLDQSISSNEPVGVIIANVSHPAEVATDEAVVRMAKRLEENMRAGDHVGRLDDHTFGLIIHRLDTDHPTEDLAEVAQRISISLHSIRSYVEIGTSHSHGRLANAIQLIAEAQREASEA